MSDLKVHSLRLKKGQELKTELLKFAKQKKLSAPFILTCCGSVSSATLRYATPKSGDKENVSTQRVEITFEGAYTPGWFVWGECLFYEVNDPLLQVCYKP